MLKKSAIRRIIISSFALILLLIIYNVPTDINNNIKSTIVYDSVKDIPVYLSDYQNYASRVIVNSPNDNIENIIELLTINGKDKYLIPLGFKAVIPENTKLLNYHIKDNILYLDFSYELLNVSLENEERLIECLIYSLCEIKDIKGISISINGEKLTKLPNSGKQLPPILSYDYGINKTYYIDNIKDTNQVTVYYLSNYQDLEYYIPITKISNVQTSKIETIISELKTTPYINKNLSTYLKASYELEQYEILENSIKLTFNNELLTGLTDKNIEEELKYVLTLSIRDTYNIENITIDIN